jgi:hypothetical protein
MKGRGSMDKNSIDNFLAEDFAKALKFYDDRAKSSKRYYRILSIYLIVVSSLLTLLVAFSQNDLYCRIISAALSATIAIATGLLAHLKCQENWLSYRKSWDALERERRFYETGTSVYYDAEDKDILFVERVEAILSQEGTEFYARHANNRDKPE